MFEHGVYITASYAAATVILAWCALMMFEHSAYITASYAAATVILAWCALAPVIRTRHARRKLTRKISRQSRGDYS